MSQIFRMVDRGARSGVCVCHRYSKWWTEVLGQVCVCVSQIFRMVDKGARSGVCVTDILSGGQRC